MKKQTEFPVSHQKILLCRLHSEADQIMVAVLWLLWLVSLGFVFLYGTWMLWALLGTSLSIIGTLMWRFATASLATQLYMGISFMLYSALLIQQAHGLVETHFGIFVLLAFLLYYRDWRPIVLAAAVIAIHHLSFYYMQVAGLPVYVFQHTHMPVMVLVHAAYVVFETLVLVLMAVRLRQESEEAATLASLGTDGIRSEEIDLDPNRVKAAGAAGHGVSRFLDGICNALREASSVAVSIRLASTDLRSISNGMLTLRDRQQVGVARVVTLVSEMESVAGHVSQESRRIAEESTKCAQTAQETGDHLTSSRSVHELITAAQQTAEQMTRLDEATCQIQTIVSMINEIAGQTNLLALNASIEAARAGDAGRGFAVVAGEVRRLSENTQRSAEQIQEVVGSLRSAALTAKQVSEQSLVVAELGSERMNSAGREFQAMVSNFRQIASSMNSLSEAVSRQKSLMHETTGHISEITNVMRDNSGRVENLHSNGTLLDTMSERLWNSVRRFRNGNEHFVS